MEWFYITSHLILTLFGLMTFKGFGWVGTDQDSYKIVCSVKKCNDHCINDMLS